MYIKFNIHLSRQLSIRKITRIIQEHIHITHY